MQVAAFEKRDDRLHLLHEPAPTGTEMTRRRPKTAPRGHTAAGLAKGSRMEFVFMVDGLPR